MAEHGTFEADDHSSCKDLLVAVQGDIVVGDPSGLLVVVCVTLAERPGAFHTAVYLDLVLGHGGSPGQFSGVGINSSALILGK